jgi:septin family protein
MKTRQHFANILAETTWNTFYEQVWRIRCEKVNAWEKEEGITSKEKKRKLKGKGKSSIKKKRKANQQLIEERKRKTKEKEERIKKEVRKTINKLVMKGGRPFHYGL